MKTKNTLITLAIIASLIFVVAIVFSQPNIGEKGEKGKKWEGKGKMTCPEGQGKMICPEGVGPGEFGELPQAFKPFCVIEKLDDLTAEQKTKIEEIKNSFEKDTSEIRESMKANWKEIAEQFKSDTATADELKKKTREIGEGRQKLVDKIIDSTFQVKGVLTKEQWEKAKTLKEGMKMHREQMREGFRGKMMHMKKSDETCPMGMKGKKQEGLSTQKEKSESEEKE